MTDKKCVQMQIIGVAAIAITCLVLLGVAVVKKPFSAGVSHSEVVASVLSDSYLESIPGDAWDDLSDISFLRLYFDEERAAEISQTAYRIAPYRKSRGVCMRWVRQVLTRVPLQNGQQPEVQDFNQLPYDYHAPLRRQASHTKVKAKKVKRGSMLPGRSARDFIQWAESNPVSLCTSLGLAVVPNDVETPLQPGFTLAYEPNQCGFHRRWGHIEIVTSTMGPTGRPEAASDHRREIATPMCRPSMILVPVTSCEWLFMPARPQGTQYTQNLWGKSPAS